MGWEIYVLGYLSYATGFYEHFSCSITNTVDDRGSVMNLVTVTLPHSDFASGGYHRSDERIPKV